MPPLPFHLRPSRAWLLVFAAGLCSGAVVFLVLRQGERSELRAARVRAGFIRGHSGLAALQGEDASLARAAANGRIVTPPPVPGTPPEYFLLPTSSTLVRERAWAFGLEAALCAWLALGIPLCLAQLRRSRSRLQERSQSEAELNQQRRQQELLEAKNQAEAGDQAKGRFLATMSHEVRTPVHGIVGFTTLLLETQLTSEQREYVQTIRTSAEALVQLTGEILDFSRGEAGTIQLESMVCDLRATIEDALDIFAGAAAEKRLELLHSVDPDVPAQVVLDAGRVRQVLVNLVGNAIKFTPGGEVEVRLRVLSGKAASIAPFDLGLGAGQMVAEFEDGSITFEFSVRDTGIGIAPDDRPKLFQPFSQLDVSSVRKFGGAGLGLAISRNLVRLMAGDIWLSSEHGGGSTFTFTVRGRPAPASDVTVSPFADLRDMEIGLIQLVPKLAEEIGQVLANSGARVRLHTLSEIAGSSADLLLVDCGQVDAEAASQALGAHWKPSRMIGLVNVNLGSTARQALRPRFGSLLNKPVHHRALLDLLVRSQPRAV
jgi:signal transduction histidine kinase